MFDLTYLSNENKRTLERLREKLSKSSHAETRAECLLEIQEIEAKAMPYQQCDLVAADELRSQIMSKINTLNRLGKSTQAFLGHLKDIEFHIQTLQMSEVTKEAERFAPEEHSNQKNTMPTLGKLAKEKKRKEAFGMHRWQIGFEDEPDDPETQKNKP